MFISEPSVIVTAILARPVNKHRAGIGSDPRQPRLQLKHFAVAMQLNPRQPELRVGRCRTQPPRHRGRAVLGDLHSVDRLSLSTFPV